MKNYLLKTLLLGLFAAYFGSGQDLVLAQGNGAQTATIKKLSQSGATMDKGNDHGVSIGQHLTVIRKVRGSNQVVGTAYVMAISQKKASIKLVNSEDGRYLRNGDQVVLKHDEKRLGSTEGLPYRDDRGSKNGPGVRRGLVNPNAKSSSRKELGVKGGLNLTNLNQNYTFRSAQLSPGSTWGFSAGGSFTYKFSNVFAVQPEVLYTRKGAELAQNQFKLQLEYIEFPVLMKVSLPLPQDALVIPHVFAGPTVAVNINSKLSSDTQPVNQQQTSTETLDYGVVFGLGAKVPLLYGALTFDIRYSLGLKSIDKSLNQLGAKNSVITALAGYSF